MAYNNPNMVGNKPEIFLNLKFGLTWCDDVTMRKHLKEKYYFQECVYPNVGAMELVLQHMADDLKDYYNKIYETTQYNYDPIANVDADESWTETRDSTNDATGNTFEFPMNSDGKRQTLNTDGNNVGHDTIVHTSRRKGNIGVTMTQQMIQAERGIILNLIEMYTKEFDRAFMLSI